MRSPRRRLVLAGLAAAWALGEAAASAGAAGVTGDWVQLSLARPLPFSSDEIGRAVAARLSLDASAGAVQIRDATLDAARSPADGTATAAVRRTFVIGPTDGDIIPVRFGGQQIQVPIDDHRGAPAARVVALVIADLAAAETMPAQALIGVADASSRSASPRDALRLTLVSGVAKGLGGQEPISYAAEASVVSRALVGELRVGASIGLVLIPHQETPAPDGLSYRAGVARLLVAWHRSNLELLGGPFVTRYALAGAANGTGTLSGLGVGARLAPVVSRGLRMVAGVGIDGYVTRIHAAWTSRAGFATPRVAAELTFGFAWEPGS